MTKEEMKDELKDRISMALKDSVLQQGFEIICKNLAELEKEKCELLGLIQTKDKLIEKMKCCAEIEEPKTRRMTNKELSRWLREKPTRERKWTFDRCIYSVYDYDEQYADKEVSVDMRIREDDGEWREPIVEVEK